MIKRSSFSMEQRRLFIVSFLVLFLELACIRWFSSSVIFLTFFTNMILMACFLGLSIGLLSSHHSSKNIQEKKNAKKYDFTSRVLPLLLTSLLLAYITLQLYQSFQQLHIDVGNQNNPEEIFFGTEYRVNDPAKIMIPIEWIAGGFFTFG